ncbi:response regulator [Candidatus Woesearchaeota archaeon]|jgi:DNA-binding NtrC family response regulator|nr:response regulator [Candidatus Woesearchaeota archaeon]
MEKILIVDDWVDVFKPTRKILREDGYQVRQVATAQEAWEKLSTSRYDIVIIDTSEDTEIKKGKCLSEILEESFPNTLRIGWTAAAMYLTPSDIRKYHHIISKPVITDDIKKGIEEGYKRMND